MGLLLHPRNRLAIFAGILMMISGLSLTQAQTLGDDSNKLRGLNAKDRVEGSYVVVLKDDPVESYMVTRGLSGSLSAINAISREYASHFGGQIGATWASVIKGFSIKGIDEDTARKIANDANVAFVETTKIFRSQVLQSPATWGIDRVDQRSLPLNNSYSYIYTGVGVKAFVVDSGISPHNEFGTRLKTGVDYVEDGNGTTDCNGHGTHVAGTLGGTTYGIAKGVDLYPVRVLSCAGTAENGDIVQGLTWIKDNHAPPGVVNMSLGGGIDTFIETAVQNLAISGFSVVVAAGNFIGDACEFSPARMGSGKAVISVANSMNNDTRNPQSNWGRCVTMFAPGTAITSAGKSSASATATMSGTSMSAPHVAGAAALYLQVNPAAAPGTVKNALIAASTRGAISNPGSSPNRLLFTDFALSGGSDPAFTPVPPSPYDPYAVCVNAAGLFRLHWSGSGDVGAYEVWRMSTFVLRTRDTSSFISLGGGAANGWKVRACNGAGCSAFSVPVYTNWTPGTLCE